MPSEAFNSAENEAKGNNSKNYKKTDTMVVAKNEGKKKMKHHAKTTMIKEIKPIGRSPVKDFKNEINDIAGTTKIIFEEVDENEEDETPDPRNDTRQIISKIGSLLSPVI